jgi:hypothetical protein
LLSVVPKNTYATMTFRPARYTEREWQHLIRQGEHEWPDDWDALAHDEAHWRPVVARICREHRLAFDPDHIEMDGGTNLCVLVGDAVIKIFARRSPIWFAREVEALQTLSGAPGRQNAAPARPRRGGGWRPGPPVSRDGAFARRSAVQTPGYDDERGRPLLVARQVAELARALHAVPTDPLRAFGTPPHFDWNERLWARAEHCRDYLAEQEALPEHLLPDVDDYLGRHLPGVLNDSRPPRLLSCGHARLAYPAAKAGRRVGRDGSH